MLLSSGNSWAGRLFRLVILPMLASAAFAQTCVPNATPLPMHPEGLAEKLGDVVITCTGGPIGGVVAGSLLSPTIPPSRTVTTAVQIRLGLRRRSPELVEV